MAKKNRSVPQYGTVMREKESYITEHGFRMRMASRSACMRPLVKNYMKNSRQQKKQVEEIVFRRKHPTVAEYCEKMAADAISKGIFSYDESIYL